MGKISHIMVTYRKKKRIGPDQKERIVKDENSFKHRMCENRIT